jgi:GNAT superfamily N-acetyltransferase
VTGPSIRRAVADDAGAVVALRDDAARWLLGRGIAQWRVGEVGTDDVLGWLTAGRLYVAHSGETLVGAVRVAWEDVAVWGPGTPDAGYVQSLMAAHSGPARGVGRRLLTHAEQVVAATGRPLLRLSCLRGNTGLEGFYLAAGYLEVGSRRWADKPGWEPVTLMEKRLR